VLIVPAGVKVHLALGYTDMRKGMDGLAMLVQDVLKKDPFSGHLFAFRASDCFGRCQTHIDRHAAAAVRTDTTAAPAEHAAAFRTEENLQ
jgi:transposase